MSIQARTFRLVLAIIFLLTLAYPTLSTTLIIPRDEDLIVEARAIVRGKVLAVESRHDADAGTIFTYVTVRMKEVLKGGIRDREIVIKEPGGEVDGRGSIIFGTPEFTPGERVLLYLGSWPDGSFCVDRMFLGKFLIVDDPMTGQTIVVRDTPGAHVSMVSALDRGVVTDRMEISAYRQMVRRTVSANRERSVEFEAQHYWNVPLLVRPPEYDGSKASGRLHPQFRLAFNTRWFEPDDGRIVRVLVNPEGAPTANPIEDVRAASSAWSSVPGSALRLAVDGTTSECRAAGAISVAFSSGCWTQPAGSAAIAMGGLDWDSSSSKTISGVTFRKAASGWVAVNPNGGGVDSCILREIVTHEMGHALGLHHSWQPGFEGSPSASDLEATMYYIAHFDGRCASLKTDDMNGIRFLYPGSAGGSIGLEIVSSVLLSAVAGTAYSQTVTASGGSPPYNWALAPASGALPLGLSLGSNGTITGTPVQPGSYLVSLRVTDAASAVIDKSFSLTVFTTDNPIKSVFIAQAAPSSISAGQAFNYSVIWRNVGAETWTATSGVSIASQNPPNNTTWGGNRVTLPGSTSIPVGQQLVITFTLYAPPNAGSYNLQFQMFKEGVGFFGEPTPNVNLNVTPSTTLTVAGPSSLDAVVGRPFTLQLAAGGGTPPYAWAIVSGSLPSGLSLDRTTGMISGVATTAGLSSLMVRATDSASRAGEKNLQFTVRPPAQVMTLSLPTGIKDSPYNQQLTASGGIPPYTWEAAMGSLPAGLTLGQGTGLISGNPTVTGSFIVPITVRDSTGSAGVRSLSLVIVGPEAVPHIEKIKYKPSGKLVVTGNQFNQAAILLLDERPVTPKYIDNVSIVLKQLTLTPGSHTVRVVNPLDVSSPPVTITVN